MLYRLVMLAGDTVMIPRPFYHYLQRSGSTSYGKISPRLFNYPMQTEKLFRDICRQMPEAREAAEFLRVRSLARVAMLLDQAEKEDRKQYAAQLKASRKGLRHHLPFLLRNKVLSRQERLVDILLAFGLYRIFRRLRHGG